MEDLYNELCSILDSINVYIDVPTKAESLRIRNKLNTLKKNITGYKQDLVAADKAGS